MRQEQIFLSLAETKAKFSKIVEQAEGNDIVVTKNGKPVVVIMDYKKYQKILNFLDQIWDLYLLEIGDPSKFGEISVKDIFESIDNISEE
ncbi:type II toxin-antitoxin system Phd/YefM family antitoxin [Thermosipho ferrireducens]|uniref:Antitoxin n=1 Tax=Thermosipho ferrireducens TaxID=2571116 RepID=A0ABX7S6A5_9BACT|nr:type II toxin-antitoxin system Phd/YefM family antitoxin [Thermosipho ferrireducens]QTA38112.1 type II toxin-antitoxin system Phd/YefM family antitoxin [Thermosipho ferrireducens]